LLVASLGAGEAQAATVTSATPGLLCRSYAVQTLQALRQERSRLVVVVQAYAPPRQGNGGLVIWLVPGNGQPDLEIGRVAIHPALPYGQDDRGRWQRFLIGLGPVVQHIREDAPLCLRVGFDPANGQDANGKLMFEMEVATDRGRQ
jgi:hypothetical protein